MANTELLLGVKPTSTRPPLPPKPAQIKSGKETSGSVKGSTCIGIVDIGRQEEHSDYYNDFEMVGA